MRSQSVVLCIRAIPVNVIRNPRIFPVVCVFPVGEGVGGVDSVGVPVTPWGNVGDTVGVPDGSSVVGPGVGKSVTGATVGLSVITLVVEGGGVGFSTSVIVGLDDVGVETVSGLGVGPSVVMVGTATGGSVMMSTVGCGVATAVVVGVDVNGSTTSIGEDVSDSDPIYVGAGDNDGPIFSTSMVSSCWTLRIVGWDSTKTKTWSSPSVLVVACGCWLRRRLWLSDDEQG